MMAAENWTTLLFSFNQTTLLMLHELQKHYILINFKCLTHKAVTA